VKTDADKESDKEQGEKLEAAQIEALCSFLKEVLGDRVKEVKSSDRLVDSPAMIVNVDGYMTSSMERIMQAQGEKNLAMAGKKDLEINPASPLMKKIVGLKETNTDFARDIAEQVFDNAMIQAGLLVDSQQMVSRSYRILEQIAGDE